jgi:hypothetical protein
MTKVNTSIANSLHDFSTVVSPTKLDNNGWHIVLPHVDVSYGLLPAESSRRIKSSNGNGLELVVLHGKVKNKYIGVSAT